MNRNDSNMTWTKWFDAIRCKDVHVAIEKIYDQLHDEIDQRGPICQASGRCCNFNQYGHRLYVTGLEVAWTLNQIATWPEAKEIDLTGPCVWQIKGLCSVHAMRPLGCRAYFCQAGTQDWQNQLYETAMTRLQDLHDRYGLVYQYMEWRFAVKQAIAWRHKQADI